MGTVCAAGHAVCAAWSTDRLELLCFRPHPGHGGSDSDVPARPALRRHPAVVPRPDVVPARLRAAGTRHDRRVLQLQHLVHQSAHRPGTARPRAGAAAATVDGAVDRRLRASHWCWHAAARAVADRLVGRAAATVGHLRLAGAPGAVAGVLDRRRARVFVRLGQPRLLGAAVGRGAQQLDLAAAHAAGRLSARSAAHPGIDRSADVRASGVGGIVSSAGAAWYRCLTPWLARAARGGAGARQSVLVHLYAWSRPLWPNWIHTLPVLRTPPLS